MSQSASSPSSAAAYKRVVQSENTEADLEEVPVARSAAHEVLLRIAVALAGVYFFYHSRIPLLLQSPAPLYRIPYLIGMASGGIFVACTVFLVVWRHVIRRGTSFRHWKLRTRKPVIVLTLSGLVAYMAFSMAFWPIYGILSPMLFTLLAYSVLCALSFV